MDLGVYCECGEYLPVEKEDAGRTLKCFCSSRVVVPLREEFRHRPRLLSAPTLDGIAWMVLEPDVLARAALGRTVQTLPNQPGLPPEVVAWGTARH